MSLETKKIDIVQLILSIDNEKLLDAISSKIIQLVPLSDTLNNSIELSKYSNTIEEKLDLEKIMQEQNYQGIDAKKMDVLTKEADIQEPIEDLLNMLD